MSEGSKSGQSGATSGAPNDSANPTSGGLESSADQKAVPYETYQKALKETQNFRKAKQEADAKLAEYEQAKLEAEGKVKEALENQKKRTQEAELKYKGLFESFANKNLKSSFFSEAKDKGCVDPELAFMAADFSGVEFTEDLSFDSQKLSEIIDSVAKAKPILFKKDVSLPNDLAPNSGAYSKETLKKLSDEELKKLI